MNGVRSRVLHDPRLGQLGEEIAAAWQPRQVIVVTGHLDYELHDTLVGPMLKVTILATQVLVTGLRQTDEPTGYELQDRAGRFGVSRRAQSGNDLLYVLKGEQRAHGRAEGRQRRSCVGPGRSRTPPRRLPGVRP